ncbi:MULTISPECIES: ABC transporter permease [Metallosphaera]|uniref:Peptide transporter n=2 Tax=Metallosphaera TaxID=41980 RepID=A0A0K1STD2_9CREN|nr:peptide transporter [Metallosphaera sedula]QCO29824.1 ABC transporter permease [Metallosphaera prunae]AKV75828.1 peptide transporter [Metallosphaera sedula]AKV78077.1 peptide transporter [Metallosphaera sedula]AKV80322.1 peptide transporter [Metallosphaera sedula]
MSLLRYLAKRIAERIALLFGIIVFNFLIFQVLPTLYGINPAELYVPLTYKGLPRSELVKALDNQFGLNLPLDERFFVYMKSLLTFHLGISMSYQQPVISLIEARFPVTALLVIPSLILSTILALVLGLYSISRQGKVGDVAVSFTSIMTYFIPAFWLGEIVLYFFGFYFRIFPTNLAEAITTSNGHSLVGIAYWANLLKFLTLPILFITVISYGVRNILFRNNGVELMGSNFVNYLRARGIDERKILYKHVTRNAVIPVVTRVGIDIAFLFAGVVFIEDIFNIPGLGRLLVRGAENLDVPLLGGDFYIISLFAVIILLALDLIYPLIDPRVKYE